MNIFIIVAIATFVPTIPAGPLEYYNQAYKISEIISVAHDGILNGSPLEYLHTKNILEDNEDDIKVSGSAGDIAGNNQFIYNGKHGFEYYLQVTHPGVQHIVVTNPVILDNVFEPEYKTNQVTIAEPTFIINLETTEGTTQKTLEQHNCTSAAIPNWGPHGRLVRNQNKCI